MDAAARDVNLGSTCRPGIRGHPHSGVPHRSHSFCLQKVCLCVAKGRPFACKGLPFGCKGLPFGCKRSTFCDAKVYLLISERQTFWTPQPEMWNWGLIQRCEPRVHIQRCEPRVHFQRRGLGFSASVLYCPKLIESKCYPLRKASVAHKEIRAGGVAGARHSGSAAEQLTRAPRALHRGVAAGLHGESILPVKVCLVLQKVYLFGAKVYLSGAKGLPFRAQRSTFLVSKRPTSWTPQPEM